MPRPQFRVRRPHRLPLDAYEENGSIWHITVGAADRSSKPFANPKLSTAICTWLDDRIESRDARILLYCLMPDHLHIVYQVDEGDVIKAASAMKSLTTRIWWNAGGAGKLWQPSFHDHGIRESDNIDEIVTYILNNPVRAELVGSWEEYPYIGGQLIRLE